MMDASWFGGRFKNFEEYLWTLCLINFVLANEIIENTDALPVMQHMQEEIYKLDINFFKWGLTNIRIANTSS